MELNLPLFKNLVLMPLLGATLVSFLATPLVIKLAKRAGLVDDPQKRKHPAHTHRGVIPRAGGLGIYWAILILALVILSPTKQILGILGGATVIVIIGLLDDKFDLSPYFRLFTNFLAAILVVGAGVGIPFITNPLGGIIHLDTLRLTFNFWGLHSIIVWADLLALFWIIWCMNMVNWSKGVDGQMPGFVGISAIILGILAWRFTLEDPNQQVVTILAFITAGAFFGFLPFNFYPQKIMPGYSGGSLGGYMLAVISILSGAKLATAILVLGIPMMDAIYSLFRRLAAGKSPVWADRGHLHHRLLSLGWGRRRIALFYWLVSAILGGVALSLASQGKLFAIILVGAIFGGIILWLNFFTTLPENSDRASG